MSDDQATRDYLPALRFPALTAIYDPLIRLTTREETFRRRLLEQAGLADGQRVLDLGSGTGTLAVMAKRSRPSISMAGADADPKMVERAYAKAEEAGVEVDFRETFADDLPFRRRSFDRVLSSLFFHHLDREAKLGALEEAARVLRRGGELHVADWGQAQDPVMATAFLGLRLFDGWSNTADNAAGALPELFTEVGFEDARERDRLRTPFGTLALYSAVRR